MKNSPQHPHDFTLFFFLLSLGSRVIPSREQFDAATRRVIYRYFGSDRLYRKYIRGNILTL